MTCFGNASADRVTQAQRKNPEQRYHIWVCILDKHHYSKAPSPGVNELYVFWNRFTCKIILILIQPQERNLWSQPSKSFVNNKVDIWDGHAYDYLLEERLQCATLKECCLADRDGCYMTTNTSNPPDSLTSSSLLNTLTVRVLERCVETTLGWWRARFEKGSR